MPIPQVETFETDITEEIRQKQGSVTDTLAAHSSAPPKTPDQNIIRLIMFVIFVLLASVAAAIWYYFSIGKEAAAKRAAVQVPVVIKKPVVPIARILQKTAPNIERFVVSASRENSGYVITMNDYASVYGNILADEKTFGNDLITLFNIQTTSVPVFKDVTINNQDMRVARLVLTSTSTVSGATTTPKDPVIQTVPAPATSTKPTTVATSTKTTATSTSTKVATSTKSTATSTKTTVTPTSKTPTATTTIPAPVIEKPVVPVVEEILDPNATYEYISYGFIGTTTLLISTSKEKLLELRGGIIK